MNGLKQDGLDLASAVAIGAENLDCDMVVCPPATLLHVVGDVTTASKKLSLGAQDTHVAASGAHTGDCSVDMLRDAGCDYVIVGHSERRADHGETDALVRAKSEMVHHAGMIAIICVGETEEQRDQGATMAIISGQLAGSTPEGATAENTVIAYEPVWAIGTGKTASPEEAQDVHQYIRRELATRFGSDVSDKMRILYGGSMKPGNAVELLAQPDIDGGLIGGAALKADDFLDIGRAG
jgi:triosephosphate isomerase